MSNNNQLEISLVELNSLFDAENLIEHFNKHGESLVKNIEENANFSLEGFANDDNITLLTLMLEGIASYGRVIETREKVVQASPLIFKNLESILIKSFNNNKLEKLNIQLLRAIGNLSIDLDKHRQLILETSILEKVSSFTLLSNTSSPLFKNSIGCLLNTGMNYEPVRDKICELIPIPELLDLLFNQSISDDITIFIGLRLVNNLSESDAGFDALANDELKAISIVDWLDQTIKSDSDYKIQMGQILVDLLELILSTRENYQVLLVKHNKLIPLIDLLEYTKQFFTGEKDEDKEILQLRTVLVRVIVSIASHDDNLSLFNENLVMNKLVKWLDDTSDKETCSAGGLFLGNLARTDKNCHDLVNKYKVHEKIVQIIKDVTDLNVIHSNIGLLKNLCLSDANKPIINKLNVIPLIVPYLEKDSAPPLQFGTVGVLKHLTSKNETNSLALCQDENKYAELLPITRVCNLVKRSDNQGIKSEGTRLIINVIKAIFSSNDNYNDYGQLLKQNEMIQPIVDLVKATKFAILQNEGIIALSLLCH
ncbi:ARM repeat-containing protein [Conidiobolus coronatus NRRL 28638]|uniref:ARM repeat-containing protein n=1 Tax=Conidiobolus coronatus (strain ATCC 28846 / CBS 209.66 / NRRL 28638) TaxID=796925 RepID=A0A137NZJ3_CONC2|nr:ARM repeat-containing protein [Conidiobolus coronatus NRRL 28638]|eukprot:KXN68260.1 ARM repeat-containing protein [Conidiobolus coronatus NRRL 28638]